MQLKQYLKLSQQLVMTPQLQQAIKLLQLSRIELNDMVREEMVENPVLEEQADGDRVRDDGTEIEQAPKEYESTIDGVGTDGEDRPKSDAQEDWERFVEGYNEYSYSPGARGMRMRDDDLPSIEQTLSEKTSLFDHVMWQVNLMDFDEVEQRIATDIVGNLNADGFFRNRTIEELAAEHGVEVEFAEEVLEAVQELDPVGVGSRDLRECLLTQARTYHSGDGILRKFIDRHLGNMEKRNYAAIMRDLGIDHEELVRCAKTVGNMEPKPGRGFGAEDTHYITPDVHIHKVGEDYIVTLNEDGLPKLKVSSFYRNAMATGSGATKDYIQERFRSAVWLIRSIHQRQNTIRKVTESIVRFQREFLDKGPQHLRPLILRDVADDIGMHESTVSRVTTNKYVHTPQGIYELKYFFNSRISGMYGTQDLASESVKIKIKQIIDNEDPKKPLSDQALADILKGQNLDIARRTVAKYREMMNILSSSKRKKLF